MTEAAMRYEANKKSNGVAYVLWFFFGGLGGHRFYLKKTGSAGVMLGLFILAVITAVLGVGLIIAGAVGIWALVDAFLIPGWVTAYNEHLIDKYHGVA